MTEVVTTSFATLQTLGVLSLAFLFIRARWRLRQENGVTGKKLTRSSYLFYMMEWAFNIDSSPSENISSQDDGIQMFEPSYISKALAPSSTGAQMIHELVGYPE